MSDEDLRGKKVKRSKKVADKKRTRANKVYSFDEYSTRRQEIQRTSRVDVQRTSRADVPKRRPVVKRRRAAQVKFLSAIIFVLFLVYIFSYIAISMNKERLSETKVIWGSIELPKIYKGIIVRDETVYKSDADGVMVFNFADGEKVKIGNIICRIQDSEEVETLENSIDDINENILSMQETRQEFSLYEKDIKDANMQIKKTLDSEIYKASILDIGQVYEVKNEIQKKLNLRNQMLLNENKGSLVNLVEEKTMVESRLNNAISNITAQGSGILSYYVDGSEEKLNMEALNSLTKDETQGSLKSEESEYNSTVAANDDIFKIVESNNWYIAAYLPETVVENWNEGSREKIYIEDGEDFISYEVAVEKIMPTSVEDEWSVVLRCNTLMDEFLKQRNVVFKTEFGVNEGLKIPNSAIADRTLLKIPTEFIFEDDTDKKITRKAGDMTDTSPIYVVSSDEQYSYISQELGVLRLGDTLISAENPEKTFQVAEVKNSKGVYVVNTGIMVYKEINLETATSNESHTVIDPELNNSVKNQDIIISDVKTLDSDKKIR